MFRGAKENGNIEVATWEELSRECLRASKRMLDDGMFRRSVSSAYYAAYSAVAGELTRQGVMFAHGWHNPAHDQLPDLVLNNMTRPRPTRFQINKALRRLRIERENADYRPRIQISQRTALNCARDAASVCKLLEVQTNGK